jgi:hypothetical protein
VHTDKLQVACLLNNVSRYRLGLQILKPKSASTKRPPQKPAGATLSISASFLRQTANLLHVPFIHRHELIQRLLRSSCGRHLADRLLTSQELDEPSQGTMVVLAILGGWLGTMTPRQMVSKEPMHVKRG